MLAGRAYTFIQVPGATRTYPQSINLSGTVTGDYTDANGTIHGFVRDPSGAITTFAVPGSTATYPQDINVAGTIVGGWDDTNRMRHSFMRDSEGTITAFDPPQSPNGFWSWATSINAEGAIVGVSFF
jgi:predicted membrane protein